MRETHWGEGGDFDQRLEVLHLAGLVEILAKTGKTTEKHASTIP